MKIGTFWCWLFGHKFTIVNKEICTEDSLYIHKTIIFIDKCERCGIDKN